MAELPGDKGEACPTTELLRGRIPLPALRDGYWPWLPCFGAHGVKPHGSPADLPGGTGCSRRLLTLSGEGYSDEKHMLMCHKTRRSHHPSRGAGRHLRCSPQHSGGLAGQEHLSRHTPSEVAPPRLLRVWTWARGDLHGHEGNTDPPRGPAGRSWLALPHGMGLVILSPPLPPRCQVPRAKPRSSTAASAAARSQLPKAGCPPPRGRVLSMLRPLCRCCFKQLLDG